MNTMLSPSLWRNSDSAGCHNTFENLIKMCVVKTFLETGFPSFTSHCLVSLTLR